MAPDHLRPDGTPGDNVRRLTDRRLSRRELMKRVALGLTVAGAGSLLAACGQQAPAAKPAETKPAETKPAAPAATSAPAAAASKPAETKPAAQAPAAATAPAAVAAPAKRGGAVIIAQGADASSLDPTFTSSVYDRQIYRAVYDFLVEVDATGKLVPSLAESWEEAPDKLSWTLKLRQGVKFHDGADFNAQAVKVTLDRYINTEIKSLRKSDIPYVTGTTVIDPNTVKIALSQPFSVLMYSFSGSSGAMLSPAAIEKYGDDLRRTPVGTGPFKFKEWVKDDRVLFERNENYWRKDVPAVDSVSYKGIADSGVRVNGVKSKAVHLTFNIPERDVAALKRDPSLVTLVNPSLTIWALRFNAEMAPFDKKEIRQALNWAIDRAGMEKALFFDTGTAANSFLGPSSLGYNPDIALYKSVDTAKAKELLAAGGQPNGFKFNAQVSNTPELVQVAQAIKSQLEAIGVTMELQLADSNTVLQRMTAKQIEATLITYSGNVESFPGLARFFESKSALNVYGYKSPEYDAMLSKAAGISDTAARVEVYKQMTAKLSEDAPWVFIRVPAVTQLHRKELEGFKFMPDNDLHVDTISLTS